MGLHYHSTGLPYHSTDRQGLRNMGLQLGVSVRASLLQTLATDVTSEVNSSPSLECSPR